ncbi:hypothetical protein [Intestinibacter sp.]
MEYNNNSINSKRIKGNRYTQDMDYNQYNDRVRFNQNEVNPTLEMDNKFIDPRQFMMNPYEYNYREGTSGYEPYDRSNEIDRHKYDKEKKSQYDKEECEKVCEPEDMTYTTCSKTSCNDRRQCCNSMEASPITAANSMPYIVQTYRVSDSIKFDRVLTSEEPVLSKGDIYDTDCITVTGKPLQHGVFKFKVEEVCFGDFSLDIDPGISTLEGRVLEYPEISKTDSSLLTRSAVNTSSKPQCCRQRRETSLQFNQENLEVTLISGDPADSKMYENTEEYGKHPKPPKNKIDVILKGSCGCTKIQVKTKIKVPCDAFEAPELTASLSRKANMNFAFVDQLYQTKLTLGCINATIERCGELYKVTILEDVKAKLLLRETVNLLSYELITVLGSSERVVSRDIPVTTLGFDFDRCF